MEHTHENSRYEEQLLSTLLVLRTKMKRKIDFELAMWLGLLAVAYLIYGMR